MACRCSSREYFLFRMSSRYLLVSKYAASILPWNAPSRSVKSSAAVGTEGGGGGTAHYSTLTSTRSEMLRQRAPSTISMVSINTRQAREWGSSVTGQYSSHQSSPSLLYATRGWVKQFLRQRLLQTLRWLTIPGGVIVL